MRPIWSSNEWVCSDCGKSTDNEGLYIETNEQLTAVVWCSCGAITVADSNGIRVVYHIDKRA